MTGMHRQWHNQTVCTRLNHRTRQRFENHRHCHCRCQQQRIHEWIVWSCLKRAYRNAQRKTVTHKSSTEQSEPQYSTTQYSAVQLSTVLRLYQAEAKATAPICKSKRACVSIAIAENVERSTDTRTQSSNSIPAHVLLNWICNQLRSRPVRIRMFSLVLLDDCAENPLWSCVCVDRRIAIFE